MSDLIERQDAIDALTHKWDGMVTSVFDVLKELPSAEPEIIRCKNCKFYDGRPCGNVDWYNTDSDYCSRAEGRTDE